MDPLDNSLVVKHIEGKEKLKKKIIKSKKSVSICCKGEGKFVPMKVAIQEASSKNSLLERINSLESRLFQLCLEIEAARTSSNIETPFGEKSKINDVKRQTNCCYPIFDFSQNQSHNLAQDLDQSPTCKMKKKKQLHFGRSKTTKDNIENITSKNGKKKSLKTSWPHLRILGC
ncbi:hypothetical protein P3L10_003824 [Capsicum annuum]|uniref:uncharacterized protein LOC107850777 n=1 Tax=Capsicum annuum TaxID=4072 RepID=UPI0007BFD8DE|nr:uncharacterized protein LOC107850777 [Capsicum annuum]